ASPLGRPGAALRRRQRRSGAGRAGSRRVAFSSLEASQPVLRRRSSRRGASGWNAARRRRPEARRPRHRGRVNAYRIRRAQPGDAEALTRLANDVSAEPESWLISADGDWRSVTDERRYLQVL